MQQPTRLIKSTKVLLLTMSLFFSSCSKKSSIDEKPSEDDNVVLEEQLEVLDFINVETISETPITKFNSHFLNNDKLYSISDDKTYMYDFIENTWTLLSTDSNTPSGNYFELGLNFLRNGKWNRLISDGLFVFDFNSNDWNLIKAIPFLPYEIFTTSEGFYIQEEDAIYFVDTANSKEEIFKFDLSVNELTVHDTFLNDGGYFPLSKSSHEINDSYYVVSVINENLAGPKTMKISKFTDDFSNLETLNKIKTENDLESGIALRYGDNLIFGLGGIPSSDSNEIIYDPSTLKFFLYDVSKNSFSEMPTPFYESCRNAKLVTYNNEYYLIGGFTIKNNQSVLRNSIEKIEFGFVMK